MKTFSKILIIALAAISLTSCLGGDYQSTPVIYAQYAYRTAADGKRDTIYIGDTIHVGDTLVAPMVLSGVYHPLTTFVVESDTAGLTYALRFDTAVAVAIASDSRPEEGYLHFNPDYVAVAVQYYCVAKKAGDYPVTFTLSSMASEPYTHREVPFTQAVR